MNAQKMPPISPRRRELVLKVCDGDPNALPYLWHLDQFHRCDEILEWCIGSRLTGKEFTQWVKGPFRGSALAAGNAVLKRLEKVSGPRHLITGRDLIVQ